MNSRLGIDIENVLKEFEAKKLIAKKDESEGGATYYIKGTSYAVKVELYPQRWLGLEFTVPEHKLIYPINTDLYDITASQHEKFAREIEADITALLKALLNRRVKYSLDGKKCRMVLPLAEQYALLKSGRLFSSTKMYKTKEAAESQLGSEFSVLI